MNWKPYNGEDFPRDKWIAIYDPRHKTWLKAKMYNNHCFMSSEGTIHYREEITHYLEIPEIHR